ncbi:hypothetical protein ABGB12_33275 [Actinocorallia sp. B10E7]|uniref:hypothetical protein n=1 Tax=Actinocorallia sp. B10E7 TaxID=3153558 RepID=UPI00325D71F0
MITCFAVSGGTKTISGAGPWRWNRAGRPAAGEGYEISLRDVGPVAWSEGTRMAAALYAGRIVEEGEGA